VEYRMEFHGALCSADAACDMNEKML